MELIKRYQVRGVPGEVSRVNFAGRTVDYWIPRGTTQHLLIAHDGQNVFDGKTSTHRRSTWEMAQSAIRVSEQLGITPPAIIAVGEVVRMRQCLDWISQMKGIPPRNTDPLGTRQREDSA